jgi:hypothetical protein
MMAVYTKPGEYKTDAEAVTKKVRTKSMRVIEEVGASVMDKGRDSTMEKS